MSHVLEHAAGEDEAVAGLQPRDEAFLDAADRAAAAQPLHLHAGVAGDRAHLQPVPLGDAAVGHAVDAGLVAPHAVVLGVGRQARAAVLDEGERPVELLARERGVARRAAHLVEQRVGREAAAERHRDQVLHQHVQRPRRRRARLHAPGQRRAPRGSRLHELERVRGHQRHAAGAPGGVAAAAGALQQPRHALGAAELQHARNGQEVHAEVERAGRHHRDQRAVLQRRLDPVAHALVERAVVQRDPARPVGPRLEQQLVPDLGLRAHVGEDERRAAAPAVPLALDLVGHRLLHLRAQVPAPAEAARLGRQQ
jgi:hypothetical protein